MPEPIAKMGATVMDVTDLELEKKFWQTALAVEAKHEAWGFVFFHAQDGASALTLQQVPEKKSGKNRVHMDLYASDLDKSIAKFEELGAVVVQSKPEEGFQWVVMADPEGNEFCVVQE